MGMSSLRKLLPSLALLSALAFAAGCGSSSDTAKQQAQVRDVQTKILKASLAGDSKTYCSLTFGDKDNWSKQCLQVNSKKKLSRGEKKALRSHLDQVKQSKVQVDGDQAIVFLPGVGPQQFKLVDGQWRLNAAPSPKRSFDLEQKQTIRDRTRFYLATVINRDANAYCVVAVQKGQSNKECIAEAKKLFKSKGYKDLAKKAQDQLKGIDKAGIDLQKGSAKVDTGAGTISLVESGPGHSWVISLG